LQSHAQAVDDNEADSEFQTKEGEGKVAIALNSALQSRKWQLTGMSLLRGHPLPASANNWTRSLQLADIPPPQSATLGLHPAARKLPSKTLSGQYYYTVTQKDPRHF